MPVFTLQSFSEATSAAVTSLEQARATQVQFHTSVGMLINSAVKNPSCTETIIIDRETRDSNLKAELGGVRYASEEAQKAGMNFSKWSLDFKASYSATISPSFSL
ncbi:uncharacterized protein E0L32_008355 [Thyridium curvatum]|uniref:Uncharacterized protein n=1 Tax=Thyridium curvatum TaxID=1093900 RepID=A0A507AVP1_9PEZI|nr:uncharacterized protein E0L32_008355 [Thyridium curvatum]TPX10786.1 hypothetical protein E0L32_008355 [Thyridium curvatum]